LKKLILDPEPKNFKNEGNQLKVEWTDGHESMHYHKYLRENCPCALCQGEPDLLGSVKILGQTIPDDIRPKEVSPVGRYAINIIWSDGHRTGIYTFDYLRGLCQCTECLSQKDE